ncbi:3-oxoacyl-ACP reductase family protein [Desulfosporosinus sp. PR]|uniref:SDR family NAD(P)-dependent oxidoreductase n=1 Tax=Candidatus Desulfosporosinus nitrosoreducens TaxID=3401928 RepID=UPI0027EF31C3|nr:3-oxoacyl-ACP reductase family protein [Desulfosporosinus sp. PR]MDQ7094603.1 3-oxoacyl-ACP reductase family protein [Desulfosporosinus sp. PR]
MQDIFNLSGKVALVTGAGQGLGSVMAQILAAAGASVVCASRTLKKASEVRDSILQKGGSSISLQVDVGQEQSVANMVRQTLEEYGTIDILINNAGINHRELCVNMTEEQWDEVMRVNLKGIFLCSRAVGPTLLKNRQGKVINITSVIGSQALPTRGPYSSSKAAVIQFTKVLALEWAPYNINVNAIGPGYFKGRMNDSLKDAEAILQRIPLGRMAEPEELAGALIFLSSQASDYVTGQTLFVDGGFLCS